MTLWIIIAVILILILLVFALGWWRLQQKKVRLESKENSPKAGKELYRTNVEFNFTQNSLASPQVPIDILTNAITEERQIVPISESTVSQNVLEDLAYSTQNDLATPIDLNHSSTLEEIAPLTESRLDHSTSISGTEISLELQDEEALLPEMSTISVQEIENPQRRLERLRGRLGKSQSALSKSMLGLLGGADLDEESWEEIEDSLITADIGTRNALEIVSTLRARISAQGIRTSEEAKQIITNVLVEQLHPDWDRSIHARPEAGKPAVILIVGVNGTGKTSTTGKLARVLMAHNITVHLAAADTFRAAAADQLELWAKRAGVTITRAAQGTDPSSVAYDGVAQAIADHHDAVIVDTAGRLHNKVGLMDELAKVKRVVEKQAIVTETLLVLDATIGQNGLLQAKTFAQSVELTGVVLTKLDGTAKGGIVFQVQDELQVPLKLVGLGEGSDDLAPFDPQAFVHALLS